MQRRIGRYVECRAYVLERCVKRKRDATLVKRKLGLEVVNLPGLGRIESISWRV